VMWSKEVLPFNLLDVVGKDKVSIKDYCRLEKYKVRETCSLLEIGRRTRFIYLIGHGEK